MQPIKLAIYQLLYAQKMLEGNRQLTLILVSATPIGPMMEQITHHAGMFGINVVTFPSMEAAADYLRYL
jgi:membrane protein YqaA with SNARE-associated domain